jgi:uncharacterized membrane protein YhaH (DUF805 family)
MEKDHRTRESTPVALLVFIACFLIFNWPLLSIPANIGGLAALVYLFLAWIVIIFCLFRYCRKERGSGQDNEREETA